jgi:hypothetical protein
VRKRIDQRSKPEGRRPTAPSRRLPPPANDNSTPGQRRFLRALAAAVLVTATLAALYYLLMA